MMVILLLLFCALAAGQRWVGQLTQWEMQSSANMTQPWYPITVPATVMQGLIQNQVYPDVLYALDLEAVDNSSFLVPWYYRTQFTLDSSYQGMLINLVFRGINYRANVYLNNVLIGSEEDIVGTFRTFQFDISSQVQWSSPNQLQLEIWAPYDDWTSSNSTDLAISFVDWAPYAPDSNMGIWQPVEIIVAPGPVLMDAPLFTSNVSSDLKTAYLLAGVELTNYGNNVVTGTLSGAVIGVTPLFQQTVTLQPQQALLVTFNSSQYSQLVVNNPQLWWPWQMGGQPLFNLTFNFTLNSNVIDSLSFEVGIREVGNVVDKKGHRIYMVNHQNILIRGAGYAPTLFLESETNSTWQQRLMKLTRDVGLNAIRFEGKFPSGSIFRLADQLGLLMLPGYCCCDSWQHWSYWQEEQYHVANESTRSLVKRLRAHPSVLSFWYSSDELPPTAVEQNYLAIFAQEQWPNTLLASASDLTSAITGPTGVKMSGPYSWEPPNYWLEDTDKYGGAFGFLTEGGPGENPLTLEMMQVTLLPSDMWPQNDDWNYHCGNQKGVFRNLRFFNPPLNARYGNGTSAADYLRKAQAATYESHRAMFEGYSRNKYTSTGVIQWMLNNAFPENIWHLFDYYFSTSAGSYFGTKRACEPIHIQYSYDDRSIWVVNSLYQPTQQMTATATVYSNSAKVLYTNTVNVNPVAADSGVSLFDIPADNKINGLTTTYFLRLVLTAGGTRVSKNDYWLSTQPDVLDWHATNYYRTPCSSYADLTQLQNLGTANVASKADTVMINNNQQYQTTVSLTNMGNNIAFMVHARLLNANASPEILSPADVAPVFWDDNFVVLLPGESSTLTGTYDVSDAGGQIPTLVVEVFNNIS
jgi:exo-1,4-beta-D-glucosaminidase